MCDREGCIAEGSSSNVFWSAKGTLFTPSLAVGLLAGITRERVLELARSAGISVEEGRFAPDTLRDAEEGFLTSSIRGLLPIARVDAVRLQEHCPGPVTTRLMAAYDGFLADEAR
jgi:branched-subunit amino acid aminotransferase/4-amino-4-deoxychorismate lyase